MAFCTYCGQDISDLARSCPRCGHPTGVIPAAAGSRQTEGLAVASLVLGLAGFFVCPVVCSIIAVIVGYHARRKLQSDPTLEGEGLAKAGVIVGWAGIAVGLVAIIGIIAAMFAGVNVDVPSDGIDALGRIG
jgi:uncharacterized membrane protein YvbJ